ncbi:MAG: hypothetical protein ACFFFH_14915 [Candidatus Thorarchaeota archaeon]
MNGISTPLIFSPPLFIFLSVIVFLTETTTLFYYVRDFKLAVCLSAFFNLGSTILSIPFIYLSWGFSTEYLFELFHSSYSLSNPSLLVVSYMISFMFLLTLFIEFQLFLLVKNHFQVLSKSVVVSNVVSYSLICLLAVILGFLFALFAFPPSRSAAEFFNTFFPNLIVIPLDTVYEFYRAAFIPTFWCLIFLLGWNIRKQVVSSVKLLISYYRTIPS